MTVLALISAAIWAYLLVAHGRFWRSGPILHPARPKRAAPVAVVVPARNEAGSIRASLASLLAQDYAGMLHVVVVDDGSADATFAIANAVAAAHPGHRASVVAARKLPPGWSGKVAAITQGIEVAGPEAEFILLTDADIVHDPRHLASLVAKAQSSDLDLVSEMVRLHCDSLAEQALIPAFVYFFQMLFPFSDVNDPMRATAAAAGGTILLRRRALNRIGGVGAIRGALIDDVALAAMVKRGGRIWLGHSVLARSTRAYPEFRDIWQLIARTAFVQLRRSYLLLALTVAAMTVTFLVPPLATVFGHGMGLLFGLLAWIASASSFAPTLRRFKLPLGWGLALPAIAGFYMAATIGSAWNHIAGRGATWKDRSYQGARG